MDQPSLDSSKEKRLNWLMTSQLKPSTFAPNSKCATLSIRRSLRTNGRSPPTPCSLDLTHSLRDAKISCTLPKPLCNSLPFRKLILVTLKVRPSQPPQRPSTKNSRKLKLNSPLSLTILWTLKRENSMMTSTNSSKELRSSKEELPPS